MAVATYEEMIKGLHTFTYNFNYLDKIKNEPFPASPQPKESKNGRVAIPEEMIKALHGKKT